MADTAGKMHRDDNMTCEEIGTELAPYAQQMGASWTLLGQTAQEMKQKSQQIRAEEAPKVAALNAAALAASAAGIANPVAGAVADRAVNQMVEAEQKSAQAHSETMLKPVRDKMNAQIQQAMPEAQQLQSNARVQRLMQLAQEKNCH
jgi:hypothetical protein